MKIFKLFVCLSLILSISLVNSFAAISVSDGSAFVTKAEFAADLNNLSNRMSSLENSLDAKIDSLVSSYLSRNGIWNGEKQTISSTTKWSFTPPTITVSSNKGSYSDNIKDEEIITKTSKAGLLTGFVYYIDGGKSSTFNSNDSRYGYRFETVSGWNWYADSGFFLSVNITEVLEGQTSAVTKSSILIGSGLAGLKAWNEPAGAFVGFSLPSTEILAPLAFFVSKGSKIKMSIKEDAHFVNVQNLASYNRAIEVGIKDEFQIY